MMVTVELGVTPVAKPPCVMVPPADALHVTLLVMFWVLLSVYLPVAVYCWVPFGATEAVGGVIVIETSGLVTVSTAVPEIAPDVAVIVGVVLGVMPLASPPCTVIVAPAPAVHVVVVAVVMFWVVPSAKVPVAVNCCVPLGATDAVGGVTAIDTRGLATVMVAVFEVIPPEAAVMLAVPTA